jgi:2-oxoglutarate dehydrogenase E2 component (dihydrolipoamide succinyltransferase)
MTQLADVIVPPNGEGTRATVLKWCKQVGDTVVKDEPLVELETDKVTVEVPAPASGTLVEVLKPVNADVSPEEVLARLSLGPASLPHQILPTAPSQQPMAAAEPGEARKLSPAVRRLLKEHSINAAEIEGTGRSGRITAQDVNRFAAAAALPEAPAAATRVPHSVVRRRIAEHMARSLEQAPHVTTVFEADLTRVLAHRARHAADYETRGARLTLTAYFIKACARALRVHPTVNATFHSDALELHPEVNIGVGTALRDQGLIVPVIHRADSMGLFVLAKRLGGLVQAARAGKLSPDDVRGGTFTISNHGVGGSVLAAPIVINQPQVAILGIGRVERRVCPVEVDGVEAIGVRSKCYLTLTIDHRALDAFQANAFLDSVTTTLEQWPADADPRAAAADGS